VSALPSPDERLLELVGDVQGLLDLEEFRLGLLSSLQRAIPSDWVSINEFGPGPEEVWSLVVPELSAEVLARFAVHAHQNPLLEHQLRSKLGLARRLSDVTTRERFHALDLYREVYSGMGLEYQMAFTLPHAPPRHLGVALCRKHEDFSDAERDLVNRARPYLIQGYRNAIAFSALAGSSADRLLESLAGAGLPPRQAETVRLVALGRSNAAIAEEIGISVRTVQKHLQHAFATLAVGDRSQAAMRAWALAEAGDGGNGGGTVGGVAPSLP
jgi:DNA-binding CsgD family transcriptional regulator